MVFRLGTIQVMLRPKMRVERQREEEGGEGGEDEEEEKEEEEDDQDGDEDEEEEAEKIARPRSGQKRLTEETELKRLDWSRVGLIKGYNGGEQSLPRHLAKSVPGVVISCPILVFHLLLPLVPAPSL